LIALVDGSFLFFVSLPFFLYACMIIRRKENGKETEREKKKTYHNAFNKMSVFITS